MVSLAVGGRCHFYISEKSHSRCEGEKQCVMFSGLSVNAVWHAVQAADMPSLLLTDNNALRRVASLVSYCCAFLPVTRCRLAPENPSAHYYLHLRADSAPLIQHYLQATRTCPRWLHAAQAAAGPWDHPSAVPAFHPAASSLPRIPSCCLSSSKPSILALRPPLLPSCCRPCIPPRRLASCSAAAAANRGSGGSRSTPRAGTHRGH